VNLIDTCRKAVISALLLSLLTACHRLFEVQWVHAFYGQGVEFIGMRTAESRPVTYFSVRIKNADDTPIDATCPIAFVGSDWQSPVSELTTNLLSSHGIRLRTQDYAGPDAVSAFIGGADDQNRDYGVEFHFRGSRIVQFYARHNWKSAVRCPFQLASRGKEPVRFPLSEAQLVAAFGKPARVEVVWGH
jgi:hypothetical protein